MASAKLVHSQNNRIRVNEKSLEKVIQQCELALQQLTCGCDDDDDDNDVAARELNVSNASTDQSASSSCHSDTAQEKIYGLLKSRFECADFKKKLENVQASCPQKMAEEGSSWDMVSKNDLWGGGSVELETDDYVLVRQEDIIEGIATFMSSYLVSHEQTKDLTPNQLQKALSKTFCTKKKSRLGKAWEGSKVIYNVASWGATAIGMYQNPALFCAATVAFRTSSRVISKLF